MSSKLAAIADAVKTSLNTPAEGEFSIAFTAERVWVPLIDLADGDLDNLRVSVCPMVLQAEQLTRAAFQKQYAVDIGVRKKLSGDTPALVDPVMAVVEEIFDHFAAGFTASGATMLTKVMPEDPVFEPDLLRNANVFLTVIRLTFKL